MRARASHPTVVLFSALILGPWTASAFYLPGVAPSTYAPGDRVPLNVNHVTPGFSSKDAHLRSVFSYDYYHPAFHFCVPEGGPKTVSESLGSILFGDRILTSAYELHMLQDEDCRAVCGQQTLDESSAKFVNSRIWEMYNLNWLVDGLPAAQLAGDAATETEVYVPGFALGTFPDEAETDYEPQLNNHVDIHVDYHELSGKRMRVVGVLVEPSSRRDAKARDGGKADCGDPSKPLGLSEKGETPVTWTYSVKWQKSSTAWATRWDRYLHVIDPLIHWWWLTSTTVLVLILSGTVAAVLVRVLRKDISRYSRLDRIDLDDLSGTGTALDGGVQEDSGWKLVHGDVFRAPRRPLLLSIFLGSGAQLFVMTAVTILFALMGFLSPSNRGSIGTIAVLLYTILGFVGGYVSARAYKTFGGESWKPNIILTPLLIPGVVFATFFVLNLFLWAKRSSGAVPFSTMLVIIAIWFVITVPLSVAGSWLGFRQAPIHAPVRTNQIPRQIPPSAGYFRPTLWMLAVGMLPFLAIYVELKPIMNSIWFSKVYYMFGFLFICYGLMTITCAAIAILMVYFLLCAEDYHWQWRAFFTAGASALYVFLNAFIYWLGKVSMSGLAGHVLYLGYSILISFLFFILTGTIGFFSSYLFVHKIYGSIKID